MPDAMLTLARSRPVSRSRRYSAKPHHVVARAKTSGLASRSQASLAGKNVECSGAPVRACTAASSSRARSALRRPALRVSAQVIDAGERTAVRVEREEAVPEDGRAHRRRRARRRGEAAVDGRSRRGDERLRIQLGARRRRS